LENLIKIRKATEEDCLAISRLIQQNIECNPNKYSEDQKQAWKKYNTPKRIDQQLREKEIYCSFLDEKLVGTIAIRENELSGFYTSFKNRGHGIGSKLLHFIEQIAIKNDLKRLYLVATPSAVLFYKKRGFILLKEVTTTFYGIDYQEFEMQKNLA
jgi:N-acetylglutamate synthase-like GNAT family acetyltransferase